MLRTAVKSVAGVALVCYLLALGAGSVVATGPTGKPVESGPTALGTGVTDTVTDEQGLNYTTTVSRAGTDRLRVRLSFDGPAVDAFSIHLSVVDETGSPEVVRHDGYVRQSEGVWQWQGTGTPSEFVYTVSENVSQDAHVGETWAMAPLREIAPGIVYEGESRGTVRAATGYVSDDIVLLGEYTTATAAGRESTLTVVVSGAVDDDVNGTAALDTFVDVTHRLDVGGDPANTTMFVVPPFQQGRYGVSWNRTFLIRGDAVWDGLIAHEYLHTRQEFEAGADMKWFVESSAFYYHALVPYRRGTMGWERFSDRTRPTTASLVLTETTEYESYRRGTPVLAALDRRIREATNNTRTLEDVYRRLNDQERLTYEGFRADVTAVAGPELGPWLDAHVNGTEPVRPPEPGQFVPKGWRPNLDERLLVCRGGTWKPAATAGPVAAAEPVDVIYTGAGAVRAQGEYELADARAGSCDRDPLGRIPGPGENGVVTVVPESNLTFVADTYYRAGNATVSLRVSETAGATGASGPETKRATATTTASQRSTGTPVATTAGRGTGFGVVAALVGSVGVLVFLGYPTER